MDTQFMRLVRTAYQGFVDKDGNLLDKPVGALAMMELSDESYQYIRAYVAFLLNSGLLNKYALIYVQSPSASVAAAIKNYNYYHKEEPLKEKTANNSLYHTRERLQSLLGDSLETVMTKSDADMQHYWQELEAVMNKRIKDSLFANYVEAIRLPTKVSADKPSDSNMKWFVRNLAAYRKAEVQRVESVLGELLGDVPAYFNFLHKKANRTTEEERLYQKMQSFLAGGEWEEEIEIADFVEPEEG